MWVCLYIITLLDYIQPIGLFFFENLTQRVSALMAELRLLLLFLLALVSIQS